MPFLSYSDSSVGLYSLVKARWLLSPGPPKSATHFIRSSNGRMPSLRTPTSSSVLEIFHYVIDGRMVFIWNYLEMFEVYAYCINKDISWVHHDIDFSSYAINWWAVNSALTCQLTECWTCMLRVFVCNKSLDKALRPVSTLNLASSLLKMHQWSYAQVTIGCLSSQWAKEVRSIP